MTVTSEDRHLTAEDFVGYAARSLTHARLAGLLTHVGHCEACRGALARREDAVARLTGSWALATDEAHPDPDEFMALVDGALDPARALAIRIHLDACDVCAEDVADIERVRIELALSAVTAPTDAGPAWHRLAAAALLVAVTGGVWWLNREAGTLSPAGTLVRDAPAPAALLVDGPVRVLADGRVSGLHGTDPIDRARVETMVRDARLPAPPGDDELRPPVGTLMGTRTAASPLRVLMPVGVAVDTDRPTLTWTPVPGATAYRVSLYDRRLVLQRASGPLTTPEWIPPAPLRRGVIYLWQVEAETPAATLRAPGPDAPEARFRVIGAEDAALLRALERVSPPSHLLLGARYAALGLHEAAVRELDALAAANPASALAATLAKAARRQLPSPTSTNGAQ